MLACISARITAEIEAQSRCVDAEAGTGYLHAGVGQDKSQKRTRSVALCVTPFQHCTMPFRYRDRQFR